MNWLSVLGIVVFFLTNVIGTILICWLINTIGERYDVDGIQDSKQG